MNNLFKLFAFFIVFTCSSLLAKAQEDSVITNVAVLTRGAAMPVGSKMLGSVKIGDNMRLRCGYDRTLEAVKSEARKKGGNAIKITDVKKPDLWSSCYRIKADVYFVPSEKTNDNK